MSNTSEIQVDILAISVKGVLFKFKVAVVLFVTFLVYEYCCHIAR